MKTVNDSRIKGIETFEDDGINHQKSVFGGYLLAYIDKYGGKCANRFFGGPVTTVRLNLDFVKPVFPGKEIKFEAHVNYSHKSIIEIEVNVFDIQSNLLLKGYLYFACLDNGNLVEAPLLKLENEQDELNYKKAEVRIKHNKILKTELRKLS